MIKCDHRVGTTSEVVNWCNLDGARRSVEQCDQCCSVVDARDARIAALEGQLARLTAAAGPVPGDDGRAIDEREYPQAAEEPREPW